MIRVFYDGKCGVCRNEMAHYQRITPQGTFEWLDIMGESQPMTPPGISRIDALKVLHVQDDAGHVHQGLDAFLVIWDQLPRFRWLYRFVKFPGIYTVAQAAYRIFAGTRFRWMGYHRCDLTGKGPC